MRISGLTSSKTQPPMKKPFSSGRGSGVNVLGDRRRADKADRADPRMLQDRVDRRLVAIDDVEDALREPGFGQQLGDSVSGRRVALRWLQDEGVAGGERHR